MDENKVHLITKNTISIAINQCTFFIYLFSLWPLWSATLDIEQINNVTAPNFYGHHFTLCMIQEEKALQVINIYI